MKTGVKNYIFWSEIGSGFGEHSLKINILSCLSEQRESSVINGFLQSRLPTTILKCFAPVITC